jgi:hypothetical protein
MGHSGWPRPYGCNRFNTAKQEPCSQQQKERRQARPKSHTPSHPDFHSFKNPGNGMCKFDNYYANRASRCVLPCSWSEN